MDVYMESPRAGSSRSVTKEMFGRPKLSLPNSLNPNFIKPMYQAPLLGKLDGVQSVEKFAATGKSGTSLMSKWNEHLLKGKDATEKKEPVGERLTKTLNEAVRKMHEEGDFGEPSRGVGKIVYERNNIDFNEYKPIQRIPLSDRAVHIVTVHHELAKNIIGIQFSNRVVIYQLEHKKDGAEEFFTLTKIQEVSTLDSTVLLDDLGMVGAFSISSTSNLSSPVEKKLVYCFSVVDHPTIYLVNQSTHDYFSPNISSSDPGLKGHSDDVSHLAFDAEQGEFLASLSDDCTCIVWSLDTKEVHCRFSMESLGVACLWHPSEPYKLLVVEQEGRIRMFNTLKKCVVVTLNTFVQPIYSADWSITNSLAVGVGSHKAAFVYDLSKLNSQPGRKVETHLGPTNFLKFSTTDDQMFASATCFPRGEIKTFQKSFLNYVWSQKRECLQGIAWVYGEPFLMAATRQELLIYESALL